MATATKTNNKKHTVTVEVPEGAVVSKDGFIIREPDSVPSSNQLYMLINLLRENPSVAVPKLPLTKLEASDTISAVKKKAKK